MDDVEEDFGGLMVLLMHPSCSVLTVSQSTLKASKGKKEKKKAKREPDDSLALGEGSDGEGAAAKKPVEVTAEDLADEEWGPVKEKGKKSKKGDKTKGKGKESDDKAPPSGQCHRTIA